MMNIYVIGPMDNLEDLGYSWRHALYAKLAKIEVRVTTPYMELTTLPDGAEARREAIARSREAFERDRAFYVGRDLDVLRAADAVIVSGPLSLAGLGTRAEVAVALWAKIPLAIYCEGGFPASFPLFLSDVTAFTNLEQCVKHLETQFKKEAR